MIGTAVELGVMTDALEAVYHRNGWIEFYEADNAEAWIATDTPTRALP